MYTVKEVSDLSNVTIKTLHHYHKIGLLFPSQISEAGYRLYGTKDLERLQEILFYRELDLSLEQIKEMIQRHADRLSILTQQEKLLVSRRDKLAIIIQTVRKSIGRIEEGETMDNKEMFTGFDNEKDWNATLTEHNEALKETYGFEAAEVTGANVQELNEQAAEAMAFMNAMASALRNGIKSNAEEIRSGIRAHLDFMYKHGHRISASDFAAQARFFLSDDFHLKMLEDQQTGLAYYLSAAAESFAATTEKKDTFDQIKPATFPASPSTRRS